MPVHAEIVNRGVEQAAKAGAFIDAQQDVIDIERLFLAWVREPVKKRNVKHLTDVTGLPREKVAAILRSGQFQKRYAEETSALRDAAAPYMQSLAAEVIGDVVARMHQIVKASESDMASVQAARVLVDMVKSTDPLSSVSAITVVDQRVLAMASGKLEDIEDLRRMASGYLNANVEAVDTKRSERGHR